MMVERDDAVARLWRERPRDLFTRVSLLTFGLLIAAAYGLGDYDWAEYVSDQRLANLGRFFREVRPYPLQGEPWSTATALVWAQDLLSAEGGEAVRTTLAMAIVAIVLAGIGGILLSLPAARSFASAEPLLPDGRAPGPLRRGAWRVFVAAVRTALAFLRAVPEYVFAFLLLAIFGPNAWPGILALAIHNTGILGRLGSEAVENAEPGNLAALRALGAGRSQIAVVGLLPAVFPRLLLYFFYRFETCVREATVLGMLGIVSLGFWIEEARARGQVDTLVFLVGLCAVLVMLGDWLSALARYAVRRAG